ncbi:MAG: DUF4956 domain-containing protein [Clostridiales bacterium]|nr:DUF4956 domain-containing protein [Clostridiales bacterium]
MLNITDFIIYIAVALGLGIVIAASYMFKTKTSRSFLATLALLPALVCVVIMMVNGSIGAGVAVAGTFSLVRFRSAPGTAREITAVFLAMATGLICGMGYFVYAGIFTAIICVAMMLLKVTGFGDSKDEKELHITIPEDLDYEGVFDEVFDKYTSERKLISVKASDMGSLFRLKYTVTIKNGMSEKDFIDKLRVRNGNLPITVCVSQLTESSAQL